MRGEKEVVDGTGGYQTLGIANANIFPFSGCTGGTFSLLSANPGEPPSAAPGPLALDGAFEVAPAISAERSMSPAGVGGDALEAGDVDVEAQGLGVSGVEGGEACVCPWWCRCRWGWECGWEEGYGAEYRGEGCRWPKEGMGEVLELGRACVGCGVVVVEGDVADGRAAVAFLDTIWREYVG